MIENDSGFVDHGFEHRNRESRFTRDEEARFAPLIGTAVTAAEYRESLEALGLNFKDHLLLLFRANFLFELNVFRRKQSGGIDLDPYLAGRNLNDVEGLENGIALTFDEDIKLTAREWVLARKLTARE